jgi:hypothetical protein
VYDARGAEKLAGIDVSLRFFSASRQAAWVRHAGNMDAAGI